MDTKLWHISANEVKAVESDDEGLAYLWLAEKTPKEICYVTMTRSQDSDDVYIERDDQAWSCYSGIEKVQLSPGGLKIYLNASGQSHLGGVSHLAVAFAPEVKSSYARIEKVLRVLLSNRILEAIKP